MFFPGSFVRDDQILLQNLWLSELLESFMPHVPQAEGTTGLSRSSLPQVKLEEHMRLVWPSVEAVRTSSKGWASGG